MMPHKKKPRVSLGVMVKMAPSFAQKDTTSHKYSPVQMVGRVFYIHPLGRFAGVDFGNGCRECFGLPYVAASRTPERKK